LPQSFHEINSIEEIPEVYMEKIKSFQKKGAISNFQNSIKSIDELSKNCEMML